MIMAIDVSNTNITLGTFKGEKLLKIYRDHKGSENIR